MLEIVLVVTFGCIIAVSVARWLHKRRIQRKIFDRIPGPTGLPVLGNLLETFISAEKLWNYFRTLAVQYYPIYKYWQLHIPVVNLLCPEDIEILLSSTKHITKSDIYYMLQPWLGTGLLTSTGSKWQNRRKILTPAFHFNILQQFVGIFVEESELLVQELDKECDQPYTDVVPVVTQFTLHAICETAMGTRLEKTDKNSRQYVNAIFRMGELIIHRLARPWYHPNFLFKLSPEYREQKKLLSTLHNFSKSVINQRKIEFQEPIEVEKCETFATKKRLAMLDLLISAKNSRQAIDDEGIREEVDTFMFEGHDTTTACISFTLFMLAYHKDIQEKVVQEIREVLGNSDHTPTIQDLQNLRYLDQVLKESLRMYPSVPFISRVSEEEIQTYSGYTIPANTIIHVHIYDLHHNPSLYPEPHKFDPERFSAESSQKRHPFAYLPFSAGPRNCIGQKFAFLEIKTVISAILRKFVLEPVDSPLDITMIAHLVLKTKSGIKIKFQKRLK